MAAASTYDVWFLKADRIYRGVPFQVVAGWVEQGRVSSADKVKPGQGEAPWVAFAQHPLFRDYLPAARPIAVAAAVAKVAPVPAERTEVEEELEVPELEFGTRHEEEDSDVDMIPLIDISLVLLIFFMMTSVVSSLSPVDVPGLKNGSELSKDAEAVTVQIELRAGGEAFYAVRIGDKPVTKANDNLDTLAEVRGRLDATLAEVQRAPEVRIACNKKIKHIRVQELVDVLDEYRRKGLIDLYRAEVNEQPK